MSSTISVDESLQQRSREFYTVLREYRWPALILLAHLPMLLLHLRNLWLRPQYQYFPIVLAVIGYLLWTRSEPIPKGLTGPKRRVPANLLFAGSLSLLIFGSVFVFSPWLAAIAFVLAVGGTLLLLGERYFITNPLGIWLLTWLLIPLPSVYELQLSRFLQRITTELSGNLLERFGIFSVVEGTTLWLAGGALFVDEACSGIVSMMSIIACGLIVAVWYSRPALHAALLIASGAIWAAGTNTLRVLTLAIAQETVGFDLATGWKHSLLGGCLFAVAFGLLLSTDRLLAWFFAPLSTDRFSSNVRVSLMTEFWSWITESGRPRTSDDTHQRIAICDDTYFRRKRRGPELAIAMWAVLFCITGISSAAIAMFDASRPDLAPPPFASQLSENSLPERVTDWQRMGFREQHAQRLFAQQSKVWQYRWGDLNAVVSIDFSFHYWHDLSDCYRSVGWQQQGDDVVCQPSSSGGSYVKSEFAKDGQRGYLLFSLINEDASPYAPPAQVHSLTENVRRRISQSDQALYQIQLWVTANREFQATDRQAARALYEQLRKEISHRVMDQYRTRGAATKRGSDYGLLE